METGIDGESVQGLTATRSGVARRADRIVTDIQTGTETGTMEAIEAELPLTRILLKMIIRRRQLKDPKLLSKVKQMTKTMIGWMSIQI